MLVFLFVLFAIAIFTAESLVTILLGALAAMGATQYFKKQIRLQNFAAVILAVLVSIAVAVVALCLEMLFSGAQFSWQVLAARGLEIFALATIAYKGIFADGN